MTFERYFQSINLITSRISDRENLFHGSAEFIRFERGFFSTVWDRTQTYGIPRLGPACSLSFYGTETNGYLKKRSYLPNRRSSITWFVAGIPSVFVEHSRLGRACICFSRPHPALFGLHFMCSGVATCIVPDAVQCLHTPTLFVCAEAPLGSLHYRNQHHRRDAAR